MNFPKISVLMLILCGLSISKFTNGQLFDGKMDRFEKLTNLGDLLDPVEKLIKVLQGTLRETINLALNQIQELLTSTQDYTYRKQNESYVEIDYVSKKLTSNLDEIKAQSEVDGIDIQDCLDENEDNLNDLPDRTRSAIKDCTERAQNNIAHALNEVKASILSTWDVIDELEAKVAKCRSQSNHYFCVMKLTAEVGRDFITVPANISAHLFQAVSAEAREKTQFRFCISKQLDDLRSVGNYYLDQIRRCVDNKRKP